MLDVPSTVTVTDRDAVPPGPVQTSEKLLAAAVKGPVVADPAGGLVPVQLLLAGAAVAVQLTALSEVHVNVDAVPPGTETGVALKDTVGGDGDVTVTVDDLETSPPAPEQVSEKVLVAASGPVDWEPDVALSPDHAPEATQEVAFVELHVKVAEPPLVTIVGLAASVSAGAGGAGSTFTVTDRVAVPPDPVQDKVKVLVAINAPLDCEPDVALLPDHAPEAWQELASVDDHVNVDVPPPVTVDGLALSETVGATGGRDPTTTTVTDCVAVPPPPAHVRENALLAVRGPVDCEPDVGFAPAQAPDAIHDVAFVEDQLSVVAPPLSIVPGSTLSCTAGAGGGAARTLTVTDLESLPPRPEQVNVKVRAADCAPVDSEPDVGLGPDHAPEAVHEIAFDDDHRNVEATPGATVGGSALKSIVGASPPHAASTSDIHAAKIAGSRRAIRCVISAPDEATCQLSKGRAPPLATQHSVG